MKLELQGHSTSSDTITVDNPTTTTRSYTVLIWVNRMITNAVLIATYDGGITRSSDQIDFIGMYNRGIVIKCCNTHIIKFVS